MRGSIAKDSRSVITGNKELFWKLAPLYNSPWCACRQHMNVVGSIPDLLGSHVAKQHEAVGKGKDANHGGVAQHHQQQHSCIKVPAFWRRPSSVSRSNLYIINIWYPLHVTLKPLLENRVCSMYADRTYARRDMQDERRRFLNKKSGMIKLQSMRKSPHRILPSWNSTQTGSPSNHNSKNRRSGISQKQSAKAKKTAVWHLSVLVVTAQGLGTYTDHCCTFNRWADANNESAWDPILRDGTYDSPNLPIKRNMPAVAITMHAAEAQSKNATAVSCSTHSAFCGSDVGKHKLKTSSCVSCRRSFEIKGQVVLLLWDSVGMPECWRKSILASKGKHEGITNLLLQLLQVFC